MLSADQTEAGRTVLALERSMQGAVRRAVRPRRLWLALAAGLWLTGCAAVVAGSWVSEGAGHGLMTLGLLLCSHAAGVLLAGRLRR